FGRDDDRGRGLCDPPSAGRGRLHASWALRRTLRRPPFERRFPRRGGAGCVGLLRCGVDGRGGGDDLGSGAGQGHTGRGGVAKFTFLLSSALEVCAYLVGKGLRITAGQHAARTLLPPERREESAPSLVVSIFD